MFKLVISIFLFIISDIHKSIDGVIVYLFFPQKFDYSFDKEKI